MISFIHNNNRAPRILARAEAYTLCIETGHFPECSSLQVVDIYIFIHLALSWLYHWTGLQNHLLHYLNNSYSRPSQKGFVMEPNQFWSLLARKLAGEASLRDLYELEKLVFEHPELRFWQRLVRELWNNREDIEKEPGGEEKFLQVLQETYRHQYLLLKTKAHKKQNRFCIFCN